MPPLYNRTNCLLLRFSLYFELYLNREIDLIAEHIISNGTHTFAIKIQLWDKKKIFVLYVRSELVLSQANQSRITYISVH